MAELLHANMRVSTDSRALAWPRPSHDRNAEVSPESKESPRRPQRDPEPHQPDQTDHLDQDLDLPQNFVPDYFGRPVAGHAKCLLTANMFQQLGLATHPRLVQLTPSQSLNSVSLLKELVHDQCLHTNYHCLQ